jgi:hypothetical protein
MYRSPLANRIEGLTLAAVVANATINASPAIANPSEANGATHTNTQAETWPSFTEQPDPDTLPIYYTRPVFPDMGPPQVVSAPLPPAVWTGAAVLAGNFVLGHFWKRRKA